MYFGFQEDEQVKLYYSKLFNTNIGKYLYDSLSNSLYKIDEKFYNLINSENIDTENKKYYDDYISEYNIRDVLTPSEIEIDHAYNSYNIKNLVDNHRRLLILSVTNKCNMDCTYCTYHEKFSNPNNKNDTMSFEIATKAIDNMIKKSLNLQQIHVGFYGGESLLEFELIKKCVNYTNSKGIGIINSFGLTTNGTLLFDAEIRRYFEDYNFQICISLDGPKSIHDRYRITHAGKGSYDSVIENIKLWYAENPEYVLKNVLINTVYAPPFHHKAIDDFFMEFPLNNGYNSLSPTSFFINNVNDYQNEYANKVITRRNTVYSDKYNDMAIDLYKNLYREEAIPQMLIPGGPCIPIFQRWYINSKGDYYPCESVDESEEFCIGNVETDVNYEKIINIIDKYINTAKNKCKNCWAFRLCGRCYKNINDDCIKYLINLEKQCINYIENVKDDKKAKEKLDYEKYYI